MKRDAIITVDVEALRHRVENDHVRKLIWGDFRPEGGARAGIQEMMELSDELGIQLSFFLDIAEYDHYGKEIFDIGRHIIEGGHDLQLHVHPEFLSNITWSSLALSVPDSKPPWYNDERSNKLITHQIGRFHDEFGQLPLAYRGGSFNLNRGGLEALATAGVPVSSNHAYGAYFNRGLTPLRPLNEKLFRWSNDIVELGITDIGVGETNKTFGMPMSFNPGDSFRSILDRLTSIPEDNAPLVMVLHSWSLLTYSGRKKFGGAAVHKTKKLSNIFRMMRERFNVISVEQWWDRGHVPATMQIIPLPEQRQGSEHTTLPD